MSEPENLAPRSVLKRVWNTSHELPDTDETVVFDESRSELLVLSDTGAAVWYLLDGQRSVQDIVAFMRGEADYVPEEAERAVLSFVQTMLERGALEVVSPQSK